MEEAHGVGAVIGPRASQSVGGRSSFKEPERRRTASGCICTAENNWILFTLGQRKVPGKEVDALHEYLSELEADLAVGDQDTLQEDQLDRKRFLKEFPRVKQELEEGIKKLHALADKADKVHRHCTISNIAVSSAGTVSGVLTILGLALTPVTAGASLALFATGVGLGAAAAVTSVSTSIVESVSMSAAETEASRLMVTADNAEVFGGAVCNNTINVASSIEKIYQAVQEVKNNVRAIKLAKVNPNLAARAKRFAATGQISVNGQRQVQNAFRGTALAMTKGARIAGVATAGVFLLMDVAFLVKEAKHLHEGAKTKSAERLRQQARELEKKLEVLTCIYESLQ
nr:apolipoprotein L3-like [Kogia breviceps]